MKRLAVLVSGGGSNLQSIIDSSKSGVLKGIAEVVLVISNNPKAYALERIKSEQNIKSSIIERKNFDSAADFDRTMLAEFKNSNIDLICLAGYLSLIGAEIIKAYPNKILNIHPALLPKFGGRGMFGHFVHEAVIKAGEKKSGATVHFVDENYDSGTIILQEEADINSDDTAKSLAEKVLKIEHKIYPLSIKKALSA